MTTIRTTGLPISEIEFPTVMICGQGSDRDVVRGAFAQHIMDYLKANGLISFFCV